MKKKLLRVKYLPNLFKNGTSVMFLHIDMVYTGIYENKDFMDSYLAYVKEQMYSSIEAFNITAQASKVICDNGVHIIFKSNVNKKLMMDALFSLFAEVSAYCDKNVDITYQYGAATLYDDSKSLNFYRMGKISSEETTQVPFTSYDGKSKSRGKQLVNIDEYRKFYNAKANIKSIDKERVSSHSSLTETKSINNQEPSDCEYYI